MSDTLTKKLRRAATLQHMNETPNATPSTIPQSFWPPDPCCQPIATAVAKRKATDVPLNTTPRIAAFLAVHSLTEIWYGRMGDATRPLQCAGLNRHEVEDERALRERSSDPLGLESCAGYREVHNEA